MEIRIRAIESSDKKAWCELRALLWPDQTAAQHLEEVALLQANGSLPLVFVAEEESTGLIGFIEISLRTHSPGCVSSPVPFIEGWYVHDSQRGQGIGRLLLEMAERWAMANRHDEIASDSLIDNEPAQAAHLAAGFTEVERVIFWRKRITP